MINELIKEILKINNPMVMDNSIVMAIIAINMTVIGLTSLADTKSVIGVDYGKFLVTKYKLLGIRMYYWLISFALINIFTLFIMFTQKPVVRIISFFFILLSLVFAIFYFFGFILIENKLVKEQIYMSELLGLYFKDSNTKHLEIDMKVNMNPGNRTSKKLSTNVINYFNNFNGDTQKVFKDIFGPDSIIYSEKSKYVKYRKDKFENEMYEYRTSDTEAKIKEISFEFFQLFRYSEMQDKLALDILMIMNGDDSTYKEYDIFRLYNLARLIVQIERFGFNDNLYKYKFLTYIKDWIYKTVDCSKNVKSCFVCINKDHIKEIEKAMIESLVKYIIIALASHKDMQFSKVVKELLVEIAKSDKYKGCLNAQEIFDIFIEISRKENCKELQQLINETSKPGGLTLFSWLKQSLLMFLQE